MDSMKLVRFTNVLAIITIVALVYWVFIFITTTVFDFRIFRENMTQAFLLSILGLFSILGGAVILNIMLNLTKIAQKDSEEKASPRVLKKVWIYGLVVSFPLIFVLLYWGDYRSSEKKKRFMIRAATELISNYSKEMDILSSYTFNKKQIRLMSKQIKKLAKIDRYLPDVSVIVQEQVGDKKQFLSFGKYFSIDKKDKLEAIDYIQRTTKEERYYLRSVFNHKRSDYLFSAHKGRYKLLFPVIRGGKVFVLYFSDYMSYGKYGS